LVKYALICR